MPFESPNEVTEYENINTGTFSFNDADGWLDISANGF